MEAHLDDHAPPPPVSTDTINPGARSSIGVSPVSTISLIGLQRRQSSNFSCHYCHGPPFNCYWGLPTDGVSIETLEQPGRTRQRKMAANNAIPAPVGRREIELPQLRCRPVVCAHKRHHQYMLSLEDRLGTGYACTVQANEVPILFLGPYGEHLPSTMLVEPHAPIPDETTSRAESW